MNSLLQRILHRVTSEWQAGVSQGRKRAARSDFPRHALGQIERCEVRLLLSASATVTAPPQIESTPLPPSSPQWEVTIEEVSPGTTSGFASLDGDVNMKAVDAFVTPEDSWTEIAVPEWGQPVSVAVAYQISNLPSNASYRIEFTLNGETNSFNNVTYGAGSEGTYIVTYKMNGYLVGLGTNDISATVDADNGVVEVNEADNTFATTFEGISSTGQSNHSIPQLSTDPGAAQTLYLDFDGNFESSWGTYSNVTTPAFTWDSDVATLNPYEVELIKQIWARVAEDFAPFHINVTTVDPGNFSNGVSLRAAIGGYDSDWYTGSAGGVGFIDGFTNSASNTVYVFSAGYRYNTQGIGGTISHEAGHGFGLSHQSKYSGSTLVAEYNPGTSDWAPLMGAGNSGRDTWWNGPTPVSSTTLQDDMAVLSKSANLFGYRTDDVGDTLATATSLIPSSGSVAAHGIITTTTDVDVFSFTTTGGDVSFQLKGEQYGSNLLALFELRDSSGTLVTSATSGYDTAANLAANLTAGTYQLVVKSTGGYGSVGQYWITGTVPNSNTAPVINGFAGAVNYNENAAAAVIDNNATIADSDSTNFSGGQLIATITANGESTDVLSILSVGNASGQVSVSGSNIRVSGILIGTFAGGTGGSPLVITLNGNAYVARVQKLLQSLTFSTTSDTPSTAVRTVSVSVSDGDGATSAVVTKTVNVSQANDAPIIGAFAGSVNLAGNTPILVDFDATVVDADSADFNGGKLQVGLTVNGQGSDVLGIRNQGTAAGKIGVSGSTVTYGGVSIGSFTGGTSKVALTVNLNASATPEAVQALLRNITFVNTSATRSTDPRTVRVMVSDGDGGTSTALTKTITVAPPNTPPTVTGFDGSVNYTPGAGATIIDSDAAVTDTDSADLNTGKLTVALTTNGQGSDVLSIQNIGTGAGQIGVSGGNVTYEGILIGTFTGGTSKVGLTVTFNANATVAAAQALIRALTFRSTLSNPLTLTRTVRVILTDGDGGTSTAVTKSITVG
ncbi:beta strand repeat-containing protein [Planctomicrobium piriforme]|uniref:Metallo-peptidase family M12B Reprolysin-like n=1 Tax=Planctomicrobium piriforme TaxID=1576369 RepID=A0A1I3QZM3_9PLAN|nr:hypothetical protein [Planctomicrobium piriforme]SFJ39538.1 Metallo-peptidase family M12B Reprolysin-like [Planctomicrobium piriforme]